MENKVTQQLKSLRFAYVALMVGVISFGLFAIIINYINGSFMIPDKVTVNAFLVVSNVFFIIGLMVAVFITNKKLKAIKSTDLLEQLEIYREAILVRGAVIEGVAFLFLASYLLLGFNIFLIETLIGLLALAFFFPTKRRVAEELKIDIRKLTRS